MVQRPASFGRHADRGLAHWTSRNSCWLAGDGGRGRAAERAGRATRRRRGGLPAGARGQPAPERVATQRDNHHGGRATPCPRDKPAPDGGVDWPAPSPVTGQSVGGERVAARPGGQRAADGRAGRRRATARTLGVGSADARPVAALQAHQCADARGCGACLLR